MSGYFSEIITGGKSLLDGLGVTFKAMLKPVVTVQYPREKIEITPNYRGHIELLPDLEKGGYRCIVCGLCQRACPCGCIQTKGEKREGVKGKVLVEFMLDFTKCSLCGLCVEACKSAAIDFSNEYELAGFSREEYYIDLMKRLEGK